MLEKFIASDRAFEKDRGGEQTSFSPNAYDFFCRLLAWLTFLCVFMLAALAVTIGQKHQPIAAGTDLHGRLMEGGGNQGSSHCHSEE
jgi:hypothetical protein